MKSIQMDKSGILEYTEISEITKEISAEFVKLSESFLVMNDLANKDDLVEFLKVKKSAWESFDSLLAAVEIIKTQKGI